ncbi:tyrosine-type recombinase/integrase [Prescottella agglutinans]|uniref:Integrase n=1 Tax=Prescottella agglutinans TaxID=1644129 RepID=A0ABT6MG02_9NOCA|nr:site-specific integrase [Prescottella agglutinans]MDH6283150.1 integrase [Prescottella agglutinans]
MENEDITPEPPKKKTGRSKTQAEGRKPKGSGGWARRGSNYVVSVELPRDPETGRRRRKEVVEKDEGAAYTRLVEMRKAVEDGRIPTTNHVTVERWMRHWIDNVAPREIRPNSLKNYDGYLRRYIAPIIGTVKLRDLKPSHFRRVHDAILKAGRSTGLALNVHWCMSAAMKAAMYEDLIPTNPVERVRPPRAIRKQRGALTNDQAKHLLQSCVEHKDPMMTRWAAALLLGGRQGELLGLTWDRVNFRAGTLDLAWAMDELPVKHGCGDVNAIGKYPCGFKWATRCEAIEFDVADWFVHEPLWRNIALVEPKTEKSRRVIPLPLPLAYFLQEHQRTAPPNRFDLVWATPDGLPIRPKDDLNAWKAAVARAGGLPNVVLHEARHSTASLLLEADVPQEIIMTIMGHSSVFTTRGYQHHSLELSRAALGKLHTILPSVD